MKYEYITRIYLICTSWANKHLVHAVLHHHHKTALRPLCTTGPVFPLFTTVAADRPWPRSAPPPYSRTTSGSTFQMPSAYSLMHRSLLKKPMRATDVMHLDTHSSWLRYDSSTSRCVSM